MKKKQQGEVLNEMRVVAAQVWARQKKMGIAVPLDPSEPLRTTLRRGLVAELSRPKSKR